jgi:hypothetical protein
MRRNFIIVIALIAVLAAACGDDAGSVTTAAGLTTTAAGGTSPTTVAAGGSPACDSLLSLAEVEALFGEPAEFDTEGSSGSTCTWVTIEDPDDLEDLAVQLLVVQVYRGAAYYAPDMVYPDAERISGIGQDAYVNVEGSVSTGALDGDWAIFVDYTVILSDAPASAKKDQVVDLLRLVHDRVV